MIEAAFRKTIEQFSDIVEFIEKLELAEEEHVSKVKANIGRRDIQNERDY